MASKTFLSRKKIEETARGVGAAVELDPFLKSTGFEAPAVDGAPRSSSGVATSIVKSTHKHSPVPLPAITISNAAALAQKQPATQQSIGGSIKFTPPFASHPAAAAPSSRNSSGGLNWRHWGQLYAEQERSPLPPVRASSLSLSQAAQLPNHPAFSTSSKDSLSSNGLNLLAETLACLDGPTPPPVATGHFVADGGTGGASALFFSGGNGILKGLTPIPVNVNSVTSVQPPMDSSASRRKPSVPPPKPGSGKPHHPGAMEIFQDNISPSSSANIGSTSHKPGALLRIDNGGSNVPIPKSKKKGRKVADAFPKESTVADANGVGVGGGNGKKQKTSRWTKEEDDTLRQAVEADASKKTDWAHIAKTNFAGSRNASSCRDRWVKHLDPEVSKDAFSAAEDGIIREKVAEGKSFSDIAKLLPGRLTEMVRRRWHTIQPHKKGPWTESEIKILVEKHREFGSKWTKIAPYIEARTASQIKNRWHNYQEKYQEKVKEEDKSEE